MPNSELYCRVWFPDHNARIKQLEVKQALPGGANLIKLAERGAKLSLRQFTLTRDCLLCWLTLARGTWPGALNNVLVSDYDTSRVSEGNYIILVPKNKQTKDGPAMLGMDPKMQTEMATFVLKIWPAFANPGEGKPFIKNEGHGFQEGTISKRFSCTVLLKSGGLLTLHKLLTKFQKTVLNSWYFTLS